MTAESGKPGDGNEPILPRRAPLRQAPRHFKVPASEFTPSDGKPPTREEWEALQQQVEEQYQRFQEYERARLQRVERERREQGRRGTA